MYRVFYLNKTPWCIIGSGVVFEFIENVSKSLIFSKTQIQHHGVIFGLRR